MLSVSILLIKNREPIEEPISVSDVSIEETQEVLRYGKVGTPYPRDERDAYILFALKNGYDVAQLNDLLFTNGLKVFE